MLVLVARRCRLFLKSSSQTTVVFSHISDHCSSATGTYLPSMTTLWLPNKIIKPFECEIAWFMVLRAKVIPWSRGFSDSLVKRIGEELREIWDREIEILMPGFFLPFLINSLVKWKLVINGCSLYICSRIVYKCIAFLIWLRKDVSIHPNELYISHTFIILFIYIFFI